MDIWIFTAWTALLFGPLIALAIIDWRAYRLPDYLTLPLIIAGLAHSYFGAQDLRAGLVGAAAGYVIFVAIEMIYKALRGRDGLGRGDAKLLAAGGAWCSWTGLSFIVLIASGAALIMLLLPSLRKRASAENKLPFGPFLALGIAIVWMAQNAAL